MARVRQSNALPISNTQTTGFLNLFIEQRGGPDQITCDNSTEFTCKAMSFWQKEPGVKLAFF
jgi:putative transposase